MVITATDVEELHTYALGELTALHARRCSLLAQ